MSSAETLRLEGNEKYGNKNYTEAISLYSQALDIDSSNSAIYGNRCAAYMMVSQYHKALADAKKSTELDSNYVKGFIREAKCHVCLGHTAAAVDVLNRLKENANIDNKQMLDLQAQINNLINNEAQARKSLESGENRQAVYYLTKCIECAPGSYTFKTLRAEALAMLGKYDEAYAVSTDIIRNDTNNVDAIFVRGLCLYYQDEIDKACKMFSEVLRLAPDHSKSREAMKRSKLLRQKKQDGNESFKVGQLSKAYELYSQALEIDKYNTVTNAKLYCNRALVGLKINKLEESLKDCEKAIELDPSYTKAYQRRGQIHLKMEEYEEAVRDYEKVFSMDRTRENKKLLQEAQFELKKSKRKDYYKILGVEKNASEDEIKKAYRKRAMIHHPDRHANANGDEKREHERMFKEIGEAYTILSDTKKKARYDSGQDLEESGGMADVDPNEIFQMFFSDMGGGGHRGGFSFPTGGSEGGGFTFRFG